VEPDIKIFQLMAFEAILALIGSVAVYLTAGSVYVFGTIAPYVLARLNFPESEREPEKPYVVSDLMLFMPIRGVIMFCAIPGGSYLYNKVMSVKKYTDPVTSVELRSSRRPSTP